MTDHSKRKRIDECFNNVKKAKVGQEEDEQQVELDVDVSRIIDLINSGGKPDSPLESEPSKTPTPDSRGGFSLEDRELRKDRGDRLLQLFREQPSLSSSASARRFEKNFERALIWDEITRKINDEFGHRLDYLTVEKVKKLLTYYKKKEEGQFDNIKSNSTVEAVDENGKHSIDEATPTATANVAEHESDDFEKQPLANLLTMISQNMIDPSTSSSTSSSMSSPCIERKTTSSGEQNYMLKKERHEFVVRLAEFYIQRMCFDNSSRSAAVNAERHNMWIKITKETNDKYADVLGGLGVEQAKKLYSNCKRRRRLKNESDPSRATQSRSSMEPPVEDAVNDTEQASGSNGSTMELLSNIDSMVKNLEKDAEIKRLRAELKQKDSEIEKLQATISQASQQRKDFLQMLDEFKIRVLSGKL